MGQLSKISTPPFLFTYWNPFDKEAPGLGQSFLNYVRDTSISEYGARIVGSYITEATQRQNTLLEELNDGLYTIKETLEDEFHFLDQRMGRIEQGIINSNLLLENIFELLKLPDSEKQRQRHIELGIKFSNQSLKDADIALDSKSEFESALKIMPQDWFVLQQLGIIYLHSEKIQNVSKAKEYFLLAAKYATVETLESAAIINKHFKRNLSYPIFEDKRFNEFTDERDLTLNKDTIDEMPLRDFVQDCYLNAALASYIQAEFSESVLYAQKAAELDYKNAKAIFFLAKYLARIGEHSKAVANSLRCLELAPDFSIVISSDKDLNSIADINIATKSTYEQIVKRIDTIKLRLTEIKSKVPFVKLPIQFDILAKPISPLKFFRILRREPDIAELDETDPLLNEVARLKLLSPQLNWIKQLNVERLRSGAIISKLKDVGILNPKGELLVNLEAEIELRIGTSRRLLEHMTIKDLEGNWDATRKAVNELVGLNTIADSKVQKERKKELENLLRINELELSKLKNEIISLNQFTLFRNKTSKDEQLKALKLKIDLLETEIDEIKMAIKSIES